VSSLGERAGRFELGQLKLIGRQPFRLSLLEIAAAAFALICLAASIFYYVSALDPERERVRQLEQQLEAQRALLEKPIASTDNRESKAEAVRRAKESLDAFKALLKPISAGRIDLINEINSLAKKKNLQLSSGIEMSRAESKVGEDGKKKKLEEALDVYPRLQVRFTVVGHYSNLRAFLAELERSKNFFVIDSVSLTNAEQAQSASHIARTSGISLSVEMTAYFRP
jgi:Tfp pilus assembly protein PilO